MASPLLLVLPNRDHSAVLLEHRNGAFAIPALPPQQDGAIFEDPHEVNALFSHRTGLPALRRYAFFGANRCVYVMQQLDEATPDDGHEWVAFERALELLKSGDECQIIISVMRNGKASVNQPWVVSGFQPLIEWAVAAARSRGYRPTGAVTQRKNAYMSNVLRLPTDKGDLYLKSPGSLFITELRFTALFREWGIAKLPEWLAWNEELNCALMPDMGGHDLAEALSMESARAALLQFAKIQQTSVLFLSGAQDLLYDRRPSTISAAMDSFCARVRKALDGSLYELSEPDLLSLAGNAARAKALLQQIDGTLPSVLHHGDLRSGNIRMLPSGPMIYDWAWAGVSHPFVDVTAFLHIHRRDLEGQSNDREQLLESYLACWQEYAPIKTLRRWFVITDALKELFMAYDDLLWVERILAACPAETDPFSADGWLLEKRRYYLERVLRRFLEKDFSEVD